MLYFSVHIRHTDKKSESKMFELDAYLSKVDHYYDALHKATSVSHRRRILMATDDAIMWKQAEAK